ncbi:MAG: glycosyltransferase family 39 protein [Plectolyngbya sp. WJT66-NPBG17]|jgi:4-amino-4-deoxy-L-arabinose transferase-like glycosyltransferase|nr:glycosyltransferase family 39 protein [Plectolyngbya sp. WJT66-NPBG17]MBW4523936.1 glycosyltransferase family 39 protein [Phormidium tanganyikae FI6-MK23]
MDREISTGNRSGTSRYQTWIDPGWTIGLWVSAIVLFTVNLGVLPLRDWDEGIVAQIAREIANAPFDSLTWLYPRDLNGAPYLNKPPLVHWLIALCYHTWGVNEWTSRLPGALLTATSVPLLYGVGREIFFQRSTAVFAALVYLTSLPVVRQGRLAMLDGAILCFFLAMLLCLLRSRRDLRWGLGVGLGFSCLCLTKGILGVLLAAIGLVFIAWDTPRLLTSLYLWTGFGLGCIPVALWNGAQIYRYGEAFLETHFWNQSFKRVSDSVENNQGFVTYYLWEVIKNGVPWVVFLPIGFRNAWENRNLGWAKLVLVWSGIYFVVISLMQTKLPWYAMPLYPAFSLVVGAQLQRFWQPATELGARPIQRVRIWVTVFLVLAIVGWAGAIYYTFWQRSQPDLQLVFTTLALTLTVTAILMARQDLQFVVVLVWGMYLTLLVLMMSNYWLWELQEAFPAKPVGVMIQRATGKGQTIYTSYPYFRPSLNFYSQRSIIPATPDDLLKHWREDAHPHLLIERRALAKLPQKQTQFLGMIDEWVLVSRSPVVKTTVTAKRKK